MKTHDDEKISSSVSNQTVAHRIRETKKVIVFRAIIQTLEVKSKVVSPGGRLYSLMGCWCRVPGALGEEKGVKETRQEQPLIHQIISRFIQTHNYVPLKIYFKTISLTNNTI